MKQKLSFLILTIFFFVNGYSQAVANQPADIFQCSNEVFDLTQQTSQILGTQDPQFFTVTYFIAQVHAESNTNAIANPHQFICIQQQQTIFARVDSMVDDSYAITTFSLMFSNWIDGPINNPGVAEFCDDNGDGIVTMDLTSVLNNTAGYNVTFYVSLSLAQSGEFPIENPASYTNNEFFDYVIYARIENPVNGCTTVTGFEISIVECTANTVSGTLTYDSGDNDCASGTTAGSYIMVGLNNGNSLHFTYTDANGNYTFANVPDGDNELFVVGQGPFTFSASPALYTVTTPGQLAGNNFCLGEPTPINDVAVYILPYQNPRPGFPMSYSLMIYNGGNTTLSGDATFQFDNTMMTYVNSSPAMTLSGNVLSIPYTNLAPGTAMYVYIGFTVMTPPTVNQDDILVVEANVTPLTGDSYPENNQDILEQLVVNSWDPNDITCREGEFITEEQADEYLHYVIRFQNEGNADAINVRIEQTLDAKLDPSTLQPIGASHDYRMEIVDNEVKFIYDNINLPGTNDEPNSHGFIVYRIKARSNVQLGDVIGATAGIYFDFNEAVNTPDITTTIQNIAGIEEAFANAFVVYPNPASHIVNIQANDIAATAVDMKIVNVLGKTVMSNTLQMQGNTTSFDVSSLDKGVYFITISSEGKSVTKKLVVK